MSPTGTGSTFCTAARPGRSTPAWCRWKCASSARRRRPADPGGLKGSAGVAGCLPGGAGVPSAGAMLMSLPHIDRPTSERVTLPALASVRVERVRQGREAVATRPFVHFHDVHELVLFGRVGGSFLTARRHYALAPHSVVFVPSMQQHDFALAPGPRDWTLVQIEAGAGEAVSRMRGMERLREPLCARPRAALWRRLEMLADWLVEVEPGDPLALSLADALLHASVRAPAVEGVERVGGGGAQDRLRPAIDALRRHPAEA